jgi:hypothetical protein
MPAAQHGTVQHSAANRKSLSKGPVWSVCRLVGDLFEVRRRRPDIAYAALKFLQDMLPLELPTRIQYFQACY